MFLRNAVQGNVIFDPVTDIPPDSDCPRLCTCDEQFQFIDCSNQSLSEIPKRLPNTTLQINLANNNIKEIQENDLSNLTVVRRIILKNNAIRNVNQNVGRRHFMRNIAIQNILHCRLDVPVASSTRRCRSIIK